MTRGKYLSLKEARKTGRIDRFCKEHPSKSERDRFERLLNAMCRGEPPMSKGKSRSENLISPKHGNIDE